MPYFMDADIARRAFRCRLQPRPPAIIAATSDLLFIFSADIFFFTCCHYFFISCSFIFRRTYFLIWFSSFAFRYFHSFSFSDIISLFSLAFDLLPSSFGWFLRLPPTHYAPIFLFSHFHELRFAFADISFWFLRFRLFRYFDAIITHYLHCEQLMPSFFDIFGLLIDDIDYTPGASADIFILPFLPLIFISLIDLMLPISFVSSPLILLFMPLARSASHCYGWSCVSGCLHATPLFSLAAILDAIILFRSLIAIRQRLIAPIS